jgi:hypothetical protein
MTQTFAEVVQRSGQPVPLGAGGGGTTALAAVVYVPTPTSESDDIQSARESNQLATTTPGPGITNLGSDTSGALSTGGAYSTVGGGDQNETSTEYATIPGGFKNRASGNSSFASGFTCTAAGDYSRAENLFNVAEGQSSCANGEGAYAEFESAQSYASGPASGQNTAATTFQVTNLVLRGHTPGVAVGETATLKYGQNSPPNLQIALTSAKAYKVDVDLICYTQSGGAASAYISGSAAVHCETGTATISKQNIGAAQGDTIFTGTDLAFAVVSNVLEITVTMGADAPVASTITANVRIIEVAQTFA